MLPGGHGEVAWGVARPARILCSYYDPPPPGPLRILKSPIPNAVEGWKAEQDNVGRTSGRKGDVRAL